MLEECAMSAKQGNQDSESAALRARLKHPVIDSDGHWVEFGPDLMDYLKEVGGSRAAEGFRNRPYEGWHLTVPLKERRERRLDQPIWWGVPTRNTLRPRDLDAAEALVRAHGRYGDGFRGALSDRGAPHPVYRRRGDAEGDLPRV
jgi:hypothetical protein